MKPIDTCAIHPDTKLVVISFCPKCQGSHTSGKKAEAARRNGRLGGRPKLPPHARWCDRKATGQWDFTCPGCVARAGLNRRKL